MFISQNSRKPLAVLASLALLTSVAFVTVSFASAEDVVVVDEAPTSEAVGEPTESVGFEEPAPTSEAVGEPTENVGFVAEEVVTEESAPAVVEETPVVEETVVAEETEVVVEPEAPIAEEVIESPDAQAPPVEEVVVEESVSAPLAEPMTESVTETIFVPELSTDKADYPMGSTVTIFGRFFQSLQNIVLSIFGTNEDGSEFVGPTLNTTADESGSFTTTYNLENIYRPLYSVVASTLSGDFLAKTTFTDAPPAINLEQCRNGAVGSPNDCEDLGGGSGWVSGNVGASQGHYLEGHSIPYRAVLENLPIDTTITLTLGYDIKHSGAHAIDYLTHYQRLLSHTQFGHSAETVNPTDGVTGFSGTTDTYIIPVPDITATPAAGQPATSFNALPSDLERSMTLFGGDITNIVYDTNGDLTAAQSETRIEVTFTVESPTAVLAWGGHIATQDDWGVGNSAGGISGSPYHMRLIDWDLNNLGNTDRSLSAAVILIPQGTISGVKFDDLNGDGIKDPEDLGIDGWTIFLDGNGNGTLEVGETSTVTAGGGIYSFGALADGTYSICEVLQSGWVQTMPGSPSCYSVTITGGINSPAGPYDFGNTQKATLTLVKTITNDNGGGAVVTDWTLSADGTGSNDITGTTGSGAVTNAPVIADTFALSESVGPSGYTAGSWSCNGGTLNGSNLTLAPGDNVTCTINNNDNAPSLTLVKEVVNDNGGTAVPANWTLTAAGYDAQSPDAGNYNLSESGPSGYTQTSLTCSNSVGQVTSVTLGLGEQVTCTFVNNDDAPSLTLVKEVINDNGGTAVAGAWTLTATGYDTVSPDAGTYNLSESNGPAGYTQTSLTCSNSQGQVTSVTLGLGENVTCTFVNDDNAPSLTLVKEVINNNGGGASASAWTLTATGPTGFSGAGPSVSNGASFDAGLYNLSESGLAGYTASDWVCVGGTQNDADTVTLGLGQSATCTITNDDQQAYITVVKVVTNDNGGNAQPDDFLLTLEGGAVSSGVAVPVNPGTYTAAETLLSGYTFEGFSGDCDVNGDVTVALGESKTCTLTNNDQPAHIILNKVVINDNGGTAGVDAFGLTVGGNAVDSGDNSVVNSNVAIALNEAGLAGYSFVSLTGDAKCPAVLGGTVTLDEGETVTCTITNNDNAPSLTLVKEVVNDNGGTAVAANWTLSASGPTSISGAGGAASDATFDAGVYVLSESTGPAGYSASGWTCSNGDNDGTISLALGDDVTCSITNNDIQPKLTLIKHVENNNGGNAVVADFPLFVNATGVTSGVENGFNAGSYTASETTLAGYTASIWSGDCAADGSITLNVGDVKTCEITNDDIAPKLTLVKTVTNNNGGNAVVADFPLFVNAGPVTSGVANTLSANTLYTATETNLAGYTAGVWGGDCAVDGTITLNEGDEKTCTITNDDQPAHIILNKVVVNNNGGNAGENAFGLTVGGSAVNSGDNSAVNSNTPIALNEAGLTGYDFVSITGDAKCPAVLGGTVTLDEGETVTCTITNDDKPAHLIVIKHVINDNGGTKVAGDFTTTISDVITATPVAPGVEAPGVDNVLTTVGSYSVDEGAHVGYDKHLTEDCVGSIALGETKTCTITNDDIEPKLTLKKVVVKDNGGTLLESAVTLTATGPTGFSGAGPTVLNGASFDAGSYDLSESAVPGYTASEWICNFGSVDGDTVSVGLGDDITCTITNNDNAPSLTLVKEVINDNGGTAVAGAWTLTAAGYDAQSPDAGTYNLSESNGPAGYTQTSLTCSNSQGQVTSVTLGLDEDVTCTFVNNDNAPSLTLVKEVINDNGGTAQPGDWTLTAAGYDAQSPDAGSYDLSESGPLGYTQTSLTCSNSGNNQVTSVTLGLDEDVTCTFVNNDDAPSLTLNKVVVNNEDGTNAESDWTLTASGLTPLSGPGAAGDTDVVSDASFDQGTYTLSESGPNTYTASDWVCTGTGSQTGNQISLDLGESAVCTIINDDPNVPPAIEVTKTANPVEVNEPGANVTFTFVVMNTSLVDAVTITSLVDSVYGVLVGDADCQIGTVIPVSGSCTFDYVGAVNGNAGSVHTNIFTAHAVDNESTDASDDDDATVTVMDVKPTVTLDKSADPLTLPEPGGVFTFTLKIKNTSVEDVTITALTDDNALSTECTDLIGDVLTPGQEVSCEYDVTHTDAGVYPNTADVTVEDDEENEASDSDNESVEVTDVLPVVDLVKSVDDDSKPEPGGTFNYTLTITNNSVETVTITALTDSNALSAECLALIGTTLAPGASVDCEYSVVHTDAGVYPNTANVTVVDDENNPASDSDNESVEVTDVPPTVELDKSVDDSEKQEPGGVFTFTLKIKNTSVEDVTITTLTDDNALSAECLALINTVLTPGQEVSCTYPISHLVAGVYDNTAEVTVSDDENNSDSDDDSETVKVYNASIVLADLTATNDVNEAHTFTVTVTKNDGTGSAPAVGEHVDFTLTDVGATSVLDTVSSTCDDLLANTDVNGQCTIVFNSATPGTVTAHALVNVTIGSEIMHRETDGTFGSSVDAVKTYIAGKIIVQKVTVGGDGSFNFNFDYQADDQLSHGESNNSGWIATGVHSVSEDVPAGWDLTSAICDDGSNPNNIGLSDGEIVTCTFTNTKQGTVTIVKDADPQDCQDFTFAFTGKPNFMLDDNAGVQDCTDTDRAQSQVFTNLPANVNYTVTEALPSQYWTLDSVSCVNTGDQTPYQVASVTNGVTINLAPGADVTCTFQNDKITPTRTIGFWSTHLTYTTGILNTQLGGTMLIGNGIDHQDPLDNIGKVMGGFWSNVAKKSTGGQRLPLDKARMQLAQQLIGAKLNCAAFGCTLGVQTMITNADTAYATGTVAQILAAASQLDLYNNSGDTIIVGPTGKADPKTAKSTAAYLFWDTP